MTRSLRHFGFVCASLLSCAFASAAEPVMAPPPAPDAQVLFNGKDLDGWDGDPRLWSVKDGVIHGETTKEVATKGNTFLIFKNAKPGDFDLRFTFRCNATNNSGCQYRSKHFDSNPNNKWVVKGYQHELRNESKLPNVSGFIYDEGGKRGRICLAGEKAVWTKADKKQVSETLLTPEEFAKLMKVDDWNEVAIIAKGNHIQHYLNGRLILDFTDEDPDLALKEGVIALQLHAGPPMWAEFKDIKLKELK
jgi:hypothetical protein